jgi:hypothetical protein
MLDVALEADERMEKGMMTSMELAIRYGVGTRLLDQWRKYEGFPQHAVTRDGNRLLYDHEAVDAWLRGRKLGHTGQRPRWIQVVGHPAALRG